MQFSVLQDRSQTSSWILKVLLLRGKRGGEGRKIEEKRQGERKKGNDIGGKRGGRGSELRKGRGGRKGMGGPSSGFAPPPGKIS